MIAVASQKLTPTKSLGCREPLWATSPAEWASPKANTGRNSELSIIENIFLLYILFYHRVRNKTRDCFAQDVMDTHQSFHNFMTYL